MTNIKCDICFDKIIKNIISCGTCNFDSSCFNEYMKSGNNKENITHWNNKKKLRCPMYSICKSDFNEDLLFNIKSILKNYVELTRNFEATIATEVIKQKIEIDMSKNNLKNISETIMNEIRNILTNVLSCPECKHPFIDFNACLALTCASCSKHFCGICLNLCKDSQESHKCVSSHTTTFSDEYNTEYGFNNVFFISTPGWIKYVENKKKNAIIKYLLEFKIETLWSNMKQITNALIKEKLLTNKSIDEININIYSYNSLNKIHNLRIPIEFAKICSSKFNIKFEEVILKYSLSIEDKLKIGNLIKTKINSIFPGWMFDKCKVPGESYYAINYPPQLLQLINEIILDYCDLNNIWKKNNLE